MKRMSSGPTDNRDGGLSARVAALASRATARRGAISLDDPCQLDAEVAAPVNVRATAVNTSSKAYQAGYAAGANAAGEEAAEAAFSAHAAGKADEALLNAVGFKAAARMLGVNKPFDDDATPHKVTLEFQLACDEYNVGYAAGWDAGEIAALKRIRAF